MKRALPILLALTSAGCAYYNAMWSAERYAKDARAAGSTFVEIQNTLLFANAGQRADS